MVQAGEDVALGDREAAAQAAARAHENFAKEGRASGPAFGKLEALENDIAAAGTPTSATTMPTSNPALSPAVTRPAESH